MTKTKLLLELEGRYCYEPIDSVNRVLQIQK